jgi:N6-L-threonylcarbamoyladenine synthase
MVNYLTVLAIETSCDETAMAVLKSSETASVFEFEILSNVIASQVDIHKKWGGVYPELASRAHLEAIIPVLTQTIEMLELDTKSKTLKSRKTKLENQNDNSKLKKIMQSIDVIAVTEKPGLIGSLLMGIETAEILGAIFEKPVIRINHLEGHIYSAFCTTSQKFSIPKTDIFPILALVVSGGHTSLILVENHFKYKTVAQTIDDAAGEAFDKVARIIALPYPGGPEIEKLAKDGNENNYNLPIGMDGKQDFSFSGLKTAVLYLTKNPATGEAKKFSKKDLAASFQKTVADTLIQKTKIAIDDNKPKTLILSGGVSANSYIRERFSHEFSGQAPDNKYPTLLISPKSLSTDNAVGIGVVGAIKELSNKSF